MDEDIENLTNNFNTEKKYKIIHLNKDLRKTLSRIKRRVFKHIWLIRAVLVMGLVGFLYLFYVLTGVVLKSTGADFYLNLAKDFIFTPSSKVRTIDGKTNILILGKGGSGHEAPDLTDTIILASFNHRELSVDLISLPRDIWIPELRAKLNSAYYWGNQKKEKGGLILSKSSVEKIVGQAITYGVVVDFNGFVEVIDVLGGIEVDVERGFVDEEYPIVGREDDECEGDLEFKCRYETVSFEAGRREMDGETALKFVRSRNAEGDEGTDFARQVRQQKVLDAIKNKVLDREVLFSLEKLRELRDVLVEYTETDIDTEAGVILARRLLQSRRNFNSHVLPEDLLENPPQSSRYDYLYVFIPKAENWTEVHEWVVEALN